MTPRDLAIMLNISQCQIHRCIDGNRPPTKYMMAEWAQEMRNAELYLRNWFKDEQDKEIETG